MVQNAINPLYLVQGEVGIVYLHYVVKEEPKDVEIDIKVSGRHGLVMKGPPA